MTNVLITIDTEISPGAHARGLAPERNLAQSIFGRAEGREVGIGHMMDELERHGLVGVFFVDPMPALVLGPDFVRRIVEPILRRGHEVELHIHTEWLAFTGARHVGGRRGQSLCDFAPDDQQQLLALASNLLETAGAPRPIAFRAGNYGANDDTLRALAAMGIRIDSSFNPPYAGRQCGIGLGADQQAPCTRLGIQEYPVSCLLDGAGLRPAQVCALSCWEMRAALHHAAATCQPAFTVVSHSFELLSRDRRRVNAVVERRFRHLCETVARHPKLRSVGFRSLAAEAPDGTGGATAGDPPRPGERLPANRLRTLHRYAAQAYAALRYERAA